jgi:outer membrane protein TolC
MNRKKNFLFLSFCFFIFFSQTFAQQTDSLLVIEPQELFQQMAKNHPIVKQANLFSEFGRQEVRLARGLFDPKFGSDLVMKDFDKKLYYRRWETQLKVPTWFGVEFKAGYDINSGEFLSGENKTPKEGLTYAGLTVPLGQGLFIDYRRAALREAQFAQNIFEAEKIKIINKVLLQAAKDYWTWYEAYYQYQIAQKGYQLAKIRFEGIVERVAQGDAAGIDSVEAKITVQDRMINLQKTQVYEVNARLMLSNHLWGDNGEPLEIAENMKPTAFIVRENQLTVDELTKFANENHPELVKLTFKLKQLEVQRRLAFEMFKPKIDVSYNLLRLENRAENTAPYFWGNDYKWGFQVAFPLLFRKERAKWQQTKIKQTQTSYEKVQVNREINNEIKALYNELKNIESLLTQVTAMINNYKLMLDGETEKFINGESSLFLVNTRETKLLEAEFKLVELQYKYGKTRATLLWAAGKSIED